VNGTARITGALTAGTSSSQTPASIATNNAPNQPALTLFKNIFDTETEDVFRVQSFENGVGVKNVFRVQANGLGYFAGNLLLGTNVNAGFRLDVNGSVNIAGGIRFSSSGVDANRWSVFWNGGTGDMIVVNNLSDIRVKKDFDYDIKGLDTIKKLKPVKFTWKDGTSYSTSVSGRLRQYGFIAQETMEADDYLAWHNKNQDTWGIEQYESFCAVIVKAIQEQQIQIENLKSLT
jgi:hypothetical protein